MRYIKMLERKDFSLTHCMISLGSCTMKLCHELAGICQCPSFCSKGTGSRLLPSNG
jgi:glycine cleavage system protein P-like pyridoxal-binding family